MATYDSKSQDEQIALFRYGIIAPVFHQTASSQTQYFKEMAKIVFDVPCYGRKRYRWKTFKHWLRCYRLSGFDGLKPKTRKDALTSRKIDGFLSQIISQNLKEHPGLSVSSLFRLLVEKDYISPGSICEATLRKFITDNHLIQERSTPTPRKKFEKPHINDLWTADFMHGPYFIIDGKKHKTFLCAIIDDHSRLIVGANWTLKEDTPALELIFKQALLTYGLPKLFYCDNGSAFSSGHLQLVCARLGIALVHSKPYDSPSRGKIERFFRTIRQDFLPMCPLQERYSLEGLNRICSNWLNQYHRRLHHGIGGAPLDRFLNDMNNTSIRRIQSHELDQHFYQTLHRLVKNDATISVNGILFEAPSKYIGSTVQLRHPVGQGELLYIYENDHPVAKLNRLDPVANSLLPFKGIKFSKEDDHD